MASNLSRVLSGMDETVIGATDEMLIINPDSRQIDLPGVELTFGVEHDASAERKYFQAPRYVGKGLDLASCFLRVNFRNANGEIDAYLVEDAAVTADGQYVTFSWELSRKVTQYKGSVQFVVCAVGPDQRVEWHTTLATGLILEGLEPDAVAVENATKDVIAQLLALVEAQTASVEAAGAEQVSKVKAEGATQIEAVRAASEAAETASVAEIEAKGVNTLASIPDDYTSLGNAVEGLVRGRAGAIVCEAAGTTIAVNDASDNYIQSLRIFGRSTQDGTPTPDAPVEIKSVVEPVVRVCGKNLFKTEFEPGYTETVRGVTFTVNPDRSIHVTGTPTAAIAYNIFEGEVFPNGNYFISGAPATASQKFRLQVNLTVNGIEKTGGVDMGEGSKLPVDASVSSLRGYIYVASDAGAVDGTFYPQIETDSVATEYEPYSGQTVEITHTLPGIPVTSGGNYTDSDGQQWICDEVDLERGVYVRRVGVRILDGTEAWSAYSKADAGVVNAFRAKLSDIRLFTHGSGASVTSILSDRFGYGGYVSENKATGIGLSEYQYVYLRFDGENEGVADVDTLKAWLADNSVTVAYILETPVETPLSETEIAAYREMRSYYPNTTVLNDAGAHMVVKYAADTKLYIDNKIAALVGG